MRVPLLNVCPLKVFNLLWKTFADEKDFFENFNKLVQVYWNSRKLVKYLCNYSAFWEVPTAPIPIQSRVYTGSCRKYLSLLYTQNWIFMYVAYPEISSTNIQFSWRFIATCENVPPAVQLAERFEESQGGFITKVFQIMTKVTVLNKILLEKGI